MTLKVLAVKFADLSLIPRTYMVKEKTNSGQLSSDLHTHTMVHALPPPKTGIIHTYSLNVQCVQCHYHLATYGLCMRGLGDIAIEWSYVICFLLQHKKNLCLPKRIKV